MPKDEEREPINWREDLKDLFFAEAALIMQEVFDEIRENLRNGTVNTSRLIPPDIRAAREDVFGPPHDDPPQWFTDDEGSEGEPQ